MADSKSLEQLKVNRTVAKRQFSRLANSVIRMHTILSEEELRDSLKKLTIEANKVMEANDEVEAQYVAEAKLDADGSVLSEQQKAEIEKTASECEMKLKELKDLIQETLWTNFGEEELSMAVKAAEDEIECVSSIVPSGNKEVFDFMLDHLERLVKMAKAFCTQWKCWAPSVEQKDFQCRIRKLEQAFLKLVSRKADFIRAKAKEDSERLVTAASVCYPTPAIKLKPTSLPKFTGIRRDFRRWRRDWEALQRQGEPTGSKEVKKFQLLDSLDDRITRDLRLMSYNTADDIFLVLENRFGSQAAVAIEIVEELQRLPAVRGHQPKRIVELIQAVEKAHQDLSDLGDTGAMKNPLVTKSIESKLPDGLKKEWLLYAAKKSTAVVPEEHFDSLLAFLKSQESIYEQLDQLRDEDPPKREIKFEPRQARTRVVNQSSNHSSGCVVCGDNKHKKKLYFCKKFRILKLTEKKDAVRRLGACTKCLEVHDDDDHCKTSFQCKNVECKNQRAIDHHYYLCPYAEVVRVVPLSELVRPREIHLLISHKEGQLVPQRVRIVGDLVLWDGPLGKTVAGSHPELFEEIAVSAHISKTHYARSMRTAAVKYEELTCVAPINPLPSQQALFTVQPQQKGAFAALGDIKKMYNSVWLEDREVHLHRFLWRDSEEEELGEYAITRVNIGDKPAGCIAQLAVRESANLPQFSNFREEHRVLQEDSYVDDILTSHNSLDHLKIITANVGQILKAGGFELKPWVFSGQCRRDESAGKLEEEVTPRAVVLPNQLKDEDNKALGLGYTVEDDKFHIMVRINFSKRKKKMRLGQDPLLGQVRAQTPEPLTQRELLSQVSGLYDPIGLATPLKQRGAILVRRAFQEAKPKGSTIKETWDLALSDKLREDATDLFEDYVRLSKVKFARALTPVGISAEPNAITFSDGSEHAYGAVLYLWWPCNQGSTVRLVESKAKLTPLDHKGEAVKAELCEQFLLPV
ncbi:gag-pol fusion poly [Labeo rohita]|uniref:Gag-pol fusion poly n=1 Tax=Labeo rohita TaxID=84645 RepID=A0A498NVJ1_LABRO|nr:gag-pol fusion poly [Labeo rohita]RXN35911.1 gag-pol fusion poly [Labeo rohita]